METRPTLALIDTGALRSNYLEIAGRLAPGTCIMAVVKANAYGHGGVEAARALEAAGCAMFGVAMPEEGARLREAGVKGQIVVLGGIFPSQAESAFTLGLTPVVFDLETLRAIDAAAARRALVKNVHVKIDTGMGRLGLDPSEVRAFFTESKRLSSIRVEAVLSHFAESEAEDKSFSRAQLAAFNKAVSEIRGLGVEPDYVEMANSAAIIDMPEAHLSLVRPGLMLYGSYPSERLREKIVLKPVMQLKTRILHLKKVQAGSTVSYGRRFTAQRESLIATLPIGYADGLPRRLGASGAEVLVRGRRAPIAGTVCMDLTMADVTGIPGVARGDEVVIIGSQGGETITAEEIAARAGTISYEIFCGISARVPRVYS